MVWRPNSSDEEGAEGGFDANPLAGLPDTGSQRSLGDSLSSTTTMERLFNSPHPQITRDQAIERAGGVISDLGGWTFERDYQNELEQFTEVTVSA